MNISAILYTVTMRGGELCLSLPFHVNVAALGKVHTHWEIPEFDKHRGRNACLTTQTDCVFFKV